MSAFRSALLLAATASHAETVALRAQSATPGIEPQTKMRFVDVVLQPESRQVLADFTRNRVGKRVQLRSNGVLLSSATLQSPLEGDSFRIVAGEHGFGGKSADDIAKGIMSGGGLTVDDEGGAPNDAGTRPTRRAPASGAGL